MAKPPLAIKWHLLLICRLTLNCNTGENDHIVLINNSQFTPLDDMNFKNLIYCVIQETHALVLYLEGRWTRSPRLALRLQHVGCLLAGTWQMVLVTRKNYEYFIVQQCFASLTCIDPLESNTVWYYASIIQCLAYSYLLFRQKTIKFRRNGCSLYIVVCVLRTAFVTFHSENHKNSTLHEQHTSWRLKNRKTQGTPYGDWKLERQDRTHSGDWKIARHKAHLMETEK